MRGRDYRAGPGLALSVRPCTGRRGLAASAHNFTPVRSIYRWQGQVHERAEGRVSLHTRRERVAEIIAGAQREHPYEVPSVSTRPIIDGNPDYLAWIAKETDTGSGQTHGPAT